MNLLCHYSWAGCHSSLIVTAACLRLHEPTPYYLQVHPPSFLSSALSHQALSLSCSLGLHMGCSPCSSRCLINSFCVLLSSRKPSLSLSIPLRLALRGSLRTNARSSSPPGKSTHTPNKQLPCHPSGVQVCHWPWSPPSGGWMYMRPCGPWRWTWWFGEGIPEPGTQSVV